MAAWFASLAAITWFVLDRAREAVLPLLMRPGAPRDARLVARAALSAVGPLQACLLLLSIALGCLLVLRERRGGDVSRALAGERWPMFVVLGAAALWLGHGYLGHGLLLSGDTIAHVAMLRDKVRAIRGGQDPTWTNFTYLGLPLQSYYAPTTFWPWIWGTLLTGAPMATLRAWLFAMHAASAATAYALARGLGTRRFGAGVAALAYSGCFAHLHLLLYRGAIPQALSLALLPLAALLTYRVAGPDPACATPGPAARRLLEWAALALCAAGLLVNYTPFAIVAGAHLAVIALWRLWRGPRRLARAGRLAAAALFAALLAACVLVPAGLEPSAVLPVSWRTLLTLQWPAPGYVGQLLVWRAWRTNYPGGAAYLGLVSVGFAAWGAWRAARGAAAGAEHLLPLLLLGLSLVLRGEHVRDIMLTALYVALLAGAGAASAMDAARRGTWAAGWGARRSTGNAGQGAGRWARSAPALILALFLLDFGSTAIQPIGRGDKAWLQAAGDALAARLPSVRAIELGVRDDNLVEAAPGPGIMAWSATEFLSAGHVEMATPAWIYADIAEYAAARDLAATGALSPSTTDLLCLLRVGLIVGAGRTRLGLPDRLPGTVEQPPLGRVLEPRCAYRAIFAPALNVSGPAPLDPRLDYADRYAARLIPAARRFVAALTAAMDLDRATGLAARLPLLTPPPQAASPQAASPQAASHQAPPQQAAPPGASGPAVPYPARAAHFVVQSYSVSGGRIEVRLHAPANGFVRLAQAWHPRLRVTRDGQAVAGRPDPMDCLILPVHQGDNTIVVVPRPDPLQYWGNVASAMALAALALCVGVSWRARLKAMPRFGAQRQPARG